MLTLSIFIDKIIRKIFIYMLHEQLYILSIEK